MSCDTDITDTPMRNVSVSFTAGGKGCWIFVTEGCCDEREHMSVRLDGYGFKVNEAVKVAQEILRFYEVSFDYRLTP